MQNYLRPTHECNHGKAIKKYRECFGLKQTALAEALGVSQQTVSEYELTKILSDNIIKKFADYFGISEFLIRNFKDEESTVLNIDNQIFQTGTQPIISAQTDYHDNIFNNVNNPLDALVAAYDKIIQAEKDKLAVIMKMREEDHKRIEILEQQISELNTKGV